MMDIANDEMTLAADTEPTPLTVMERAALAEWAYAHADAVRFPLLSAQDIARLRFLVWRRAQGLLTATEPESSSESDWAQLLAVPPVVTAGDCAPVHTAERLPCGAWCSTTGCRCGECA